MDSSSTHVTTTSNSPSCEIASSSTLENANKTSLLRFLISNAAAGCVIGKGGATITEFQARSGARIQLSRNHEYFPGTTDRIIVLSGTIDDILAAFELILSRIYSEGEDLKTKANHVKLIVPHVVCGAIIGKGGATIRNFVRESSATIKLSSPGDSFPGTQDRLVTISGSLEEQLRAVTLITKKISEDVNYIQCSSSPLIGKSVWGLQQHFPSPCTAVATQPYTYGNTSYSAYPMKAMVPSYIPLHSQPLPVSVPVVASSPNVFSVMGVRDECIGAIVGRNGKTISEMQQRWGVHIKISNQGDYLPGTNERKVTIIGSLNNIYAAQQMIQHKINQSYYLIDNKR